MFNNTSFHFRPQRTARLIFGAALFAAMAQPAQAVFVDPGIPIPTQLLSFGLTADIFLPLATTSTLSGAPAATVDGYGWVNSRVALSLSTTTPSTGQARLSVPFNFFLDGANFDAASAVKAATREASASRARWQTRAPYASTASSMSFLTLP